MKKLIYLFSVLLMVFFISACDKNSRLDELSVQKLILPDVGAAVVVPPCSQETAWAGCNFYNGGYANFTRGNWALYTEYLGSAGTINDEKTIWLMAGQNFWVGWVRLEPIPGDEDNIKIKIQLFEGWCLQTVEEPVKIQDYEARPSGNPRPGQFEYKGTPELVNGWYEMVVPLNNFYGIHVDLGCCN